MSDLTSLDDLSEIVSTYQNVLDQLIEQTGKSARFYFEPEPPEDDSDSDLINIGGVRRPFYKDPSNDLVEPSFEEFKCITQWISSRDDIQDVGIGLPRSRRKLKTYITHLPTILSADYIVPSYDVVKYHGYRYRVDGDPQPLGLQEDRYVEVYLTRVINET